jgi:hypothetical protein
MSVWSVIEVYHYGMVNALYVAGMSILTHMIFFATYAIGVVRLAAALENQIA